MKRAMFAVLPGLFLGACTFQDDRMSARVIERSFARLNDPATDIVGAVPATALASLPGDARKGGLTSVRPFGDGFVQDIRLPDDDAQNAIQLSVRKSASTLDEPISIQKPSESSIRAELVARFPNVTMKIVETPRYNTYGPYGMAVGSTPEGTRCAYLWQWIEERSRLQSIPNAAQVSLRVRICRPAMTLDDLAALVSNVRLGPAVTAADKSQSPKPKVEKPQVRDAVVNNAASRRMVVRNDAQPFSPVAADGAPRYIVPLPGASAVETAATSIPLPRSVRAVTPAQPPRTAATDEARLNLPLEAYNARKIGGLEAGPAPLIAADPSR